MNYKNQLISWVWVRIWLRVRVRVRVTVVIPLLLIRSGNKNEFLGKYEIYDQDKVRITYLISPTKMAVSAVLDLLQLLKY
jgi:hypothetical protein